MKKLKYITIACVCVCLCLLASMCSKQVSESSSPDTVQGTTVATSTKAVEKATNKPVSSSAPHATKVENDSEQTNNTTVVPTTTPYDPQSGVNAESDKVLINNFTPICQYPELPTGCEMTSLTMALQYYGLGADKCNISDNFLQKGDVGSTDFNVAFVGNPRDNSSYGCYAPVVVNTANNYLQYVGSNYVAQNLTGTSLSGLYAYIKKNIPVIVWGTQDCREGHYSVTWNVEGRDLTWFTPEHCMVLVGYDAENVYVADPIYGEIKAYNKYVFENAYNSLKQQAVIIK